MNSIPEVVRGMMRKYQKTDRRTPRPRWHLEQLETRDAPARTNLIDFGTATSPVATGYTGVPLVAYTPALGYGWQSITGMTAVDRGTTNPLTSSLQLGTDSTFLADVANGAYDVTATLGDSASVRDNVSVWAEGQQLVTNVSTTAGQFLEVRGRVSVTNGQFTLRIKDNGGVNPNFAIAGLTFTRVKLTFPSLWDNSAPTAQTATTDTSAVELGVQFTPVADGYITGLRFYKASTNTGTHIGHLWTATGQQLASATFTNETASGWQQVTFVQPIAVHANVTYVASYFAPVGNYSYTNYYFQASGIWRGQLNALPNGTSGNGEYFYGANGGFPTLSKNAANYWVDATFQPANTTGAGPTANAGPNITAKEGSTVQFSGSAVGTGLTYAWTFGDGSTGSGTLIPTHAYADNGTYTATLNVTSPTGAIATNTTVVSVANVAPTGTFTNNGPVAVGSPVTFSFTGVFDPSSVDTAAGFRYSYDFNNDGIFDVSNSTNSTATYTFTSAGTYTIKGRVADKDGGFTDYTTTTTVNAQSTGYSGILRTVYVSTAGSDTANGSSATPWKTLQHAADVALPGDMIVVRAGTYMGFQITQSGSATNPIVFKADPGVLVNVKQTNVSALLGAINLEGASYVAIDGFTVTMATSGSVKTNIRSVSNTGVIIRNNVIDSASWWGILTGGSANILVENNRITNTQIQHGIYIGNSADNPIIRNNYVANSRNCGIQINGDVTLGGDGIISGAIVEGNTLINNAIGGGSSMNFDGVQTALIRNNVLHGNANGMAFYQDTGGGPSMNNTIVGNTIVFDPSAGYYALGFTGGSGNRVYDNILYRQATSIYGSIGVDSAAQVGFLSDYNVVVDRFNRDSVNDTLPVTLAQWRTQTGQDTHSIVATPDQLFVNWQSNDFHLKAGSPAINAGVGRSDLTTDITGAARPVGGQTDIGSYEWLG